MTDCIGFIQLLLNEKPSKLFVFKLFCLDWLSITLNHNSCCYNVVKLVYLKWVNLGMMSRGLDMRQTDQMSIDYTPSEDEDFMNARQLEYFRNKLLKWKQEIIQSTRETLQNLQQDERNHPDITDRASSETDKALELRIRDRQRKLVSKIDSALSRIEQGTYGYCEVTGEPIGLRRLDARPIVTLSLEAQEMHERRERVYRDD